MPNIVYVDIKNFRTIHRLSWYPGHGTNCLIGAGDSGKTTVLDALDFCLGARRNISFSDYDFFNSDVSQSISITVALGALEASLLNFDSYGEYLAGYDSTNANFEEEPRNGLETVLILQMKVEKDLEPQWRLYSKRAEEKALERNLRWEDRQAISPVRLGEHTDWHLTWRKGALFERLSDEKLGLNAGLSDAARKARSDFGQLANAELTKALETVKQSAKSLGVPTGDQVQALLDAGSVKFGTGAISLHGTNNVPLASLGTGSKRLLVAGLAKAVTNSANIALVDELETGLEPHRIRSLLKELGTKSKDNRQQVFATTHSPVVLRELNHSQLSILRKDNTGKHIAITPGETAQGILRAHSEVFLGNRVVVCEGPSEIGFIRGMDRHHCEHGSTSYEVLGTVATNAAGTSRILGPAEEFLRLGYPTAIFMDSDKPLAPQDETRFKSNGGVIFRWPNNWALEDAIFQCVPPQVIVALLHYAQSLPSGAKIDDHIRSASNGVFGIDNVIHWATTGEINQDTLTKLGTAARTGEWFKRIDPYEHLVQHILSPDWSSLNPNLTKTADDLWKWTVNVN
ncbi:MAG: ATP-dependent endonuclease [Hyphomicrobiales bacterium]